MRPVKSGWTAWPEAAPFVPFVPFASELLAGPDVGDNLLMAVLARTGEVGCWIVLIWAVVGVGVGVTWVIL